MTEDLKELYRRSQAQSPAPGGSVLAKLLAEAVELQAGKRHSAADGYTPDRYKALGDEKPTAWPRHKRRRLSVEGAGDVRKFDTLAMLERAAGL